MDFILAKKTKSRKTAPTNPTVDNPPPMEQLPVAVAPAVTPSVASAAATPAAAAPVAAAAAAVQAPPLASGAVAAPTPARRSRVGWIAAAAIVLLAAGTGSIAVLYDNLKPKTPVAKVEEPPKVTTVLQGGGLATVATGCKIDHPTTLADDFKNADPGWTLPAQIAYLADGQLALKAVEGQIGRALYQPLRFKNVAVCAQVKSPAQIGALDGTADAGVMFWATDTTNFYIASVYLNGTYSIERQASGTWATVAPRAPFAGIKQGPNVVNEIQVITKDNIGTLFINGAKVQEFRGQPPKDNSMIGLYGSSNKDERNEWRILSFVAADPDRPQARSPQKMPTPQIALGCKPSRSVAFEDKFNSVDPGWGIAANTAASYVDGQLAIKPPADKVWRELYSSLFFKNATVCIRIKSPSELAKLDGTANGGLAFWGINRSNYYTADIYPDGHIDVYRSINNVFVKVLPAVKSAAVKTGLGAINELMVVYSGDMAAFHVNGQKVFEFRGQPPQNGGSIGLFAQSEKDKESDWRFLDIVVVENE